MRERLAVTCACHANREYGRAAPDRASASERSRHRADAGAGGARRQWSRCLVPGASVPGFRHERDGLRHAADPAAAVVVLAGQCAAGGGGEVASKDCCKYVMGAVVATA
jgi:hypothetical protein